MLMVTYKNPNFIDNMEYIKYKQSKLNASNVHAHFKFRV